MRTSLFALLCLFVLSTARADWPARVFAPYMYLGAGDDFKLTDCDDATGQKHYTLAFIIAYAVYSWVLIRNLEPLRKKYRTARSWRWWPPSRSGRSSNIFSWFPCRWKVWSWRCWMPSGTPLK